MKFTLVISLLISINVYSQTWAPLGATWHYSEGFFDIPYPIMEDFVKYSVEKDTAINDIQCKKIIKNQDFACTGRPFIEYTYSQGDTIFFYEPDLDTFQILYNFSCTQGEYWDIIIQTYEIDTLKVTVDSTDFVQINNFNLKRLYVTYNALNCGYSYNSEIIESIGDIKQMFNFTPCWYLACDGAFSKGLRCFSDSVIGLYQTDESVDCEYIRYYEFISTHEDSNNRQLLSFDKSSNIILFSGDHFSDISYKIIDITGKIILNDKLYWNKNIDISTLKEGFYIVNIYEANNKISQIEIIK